jgi:hypothetical protein
LLVPVSFLINLGDKPMELIESMRSIGITFPPPGVVLYQILERLSQGRPLKIVETGCLRDTTYKACFDDGWSTYYFARWVKAHPASKLTTIELALENVKTCKHFLEEQNLSEYVTFQGADSLEALSWAWSDIDVFFLDSCDGLDHGLAEFKAALTHRPKLIIMDDFETKVASAAKYAEGLGIEISQEYRYAVFNTGKYFAEQTVTA